MRLHTRLVAAFAVVGIVIMSSCTPEQITRLEQATGVQFTQQERDVLLALPDAPDRYQHFDPNVERWHDTAIRAGWPESLWKWQSCIIQRESRGIPTAFNPLDAAGGSRGLMQMNGTHLRWLRSAGVISVLDDLYDPLTNLIAARMLRESSGTDPWRATRSNC